MHHALGLRQNVWNETTYLYRQCIYPCLSSALFLQYDVKWRNNNWSQTEFLIVNVYDDDGRCTRFVTTIEKWWQLMSFQYQVYCAEMFAHFDCVGRSVGRSGRYCLLSLQLPRIYFQTEWQVKRRRPLIGKTWNKLNPDARFPIITVVAVDWPITFVKIQWKLLFFFFISVLPPPHPRLTLTSQPVMVFIQCVEWIIGFWMDAGYKVKANGMW